MDCRVVVEAAVPVYDVETPDEAVRIAISKTGEMLNPDLNYVEIEMGERTAPGGEELPPAFIAADEALVALELEMTVFNVEREEHASRIARKEIGQRLENVPLKVLTIEELPDEEEGDEPESDSPAEETRAESASEDDASDEPSADTTEPASEGDTTGEDGDLIPEFEDLVDEES